MPEELCSYKHHCAVVHSSISMVPILEECMTYPFDHLGGDTRFSLLPLPIPQVIYKLTCPLSGQIRYVGHTCNPKHRFIEHRRPGAGGTSEKIAWLTHLRTHGLQPICTIVEEVEPSEHAHLRELRWCLHYIQAGEPLTNGEVMHSPTVTHMAQGLTCDFLHEPVGSDIWKLLAWAAKEDSKYRREGYHPSHDHLPPCEYRSIGHARKQGRLSIEAWTPPPTQRETAWWDYYHSQLDNGLPFAD